MAPKYSPTHRGQPGGEPNEDSQAQSQSSMSSSIQPPFRTMVNPLELERFIAEVDPGTIQLRESGLFGATLQDNEAQALEEEAVETNELPRGRMANQDRIYQDQLLVDSSIIQVGESRNDANVARAEMATPSEAIAGKMGKVSSRLEDMAGATSGLLDIMGRIEVTKKRCTDILNTLADIFNAPPKVLKDLHSILGNTLRIETQYEKVLQELEGLALMKSDVARFVSWNEYRAKENHQQIVKSLERFDNSLKDIEIATIVMNCNLKPIVERQPVIEAKVDNLGEQTETIMSKLVLLGEKVALMETDAAVLGRNSTVVLQQGKLITAQLKQLHQAQRRQFRLTQSSNTARSEAEEKLLSAMSALTLKNPFFHLCNDGGEREALRSGLSTTGSTFPSSNNDDEDFIDTSAMMEGHERGLPKRLSKKTLEAAGYSMLVVLPFWLVFNLVVLEWDIKTASLAWVLGNTLLLALMPFMSAAMKLVDVWWK